MADSFKTDNRYLKSMSKKVGNVDDGKTHTDNYYLKRIEAKIGQGGGGYDDTDLKEKMGYDNIPVGENLQGQITDLEGTVGDLGDGKADKVHTHTESDITDLGDYIEKSNIDGLVKNDGTIDEHTYSQSGHTHLMSDITDLSLPAAVKVVTTLPSASADTMDKLFILVGNDTVDVYYTTKSGNTYSWNKMDDDILDNLSIEWSDIHNKPSIPADVSDLTDTTGVIPTDISDLTDTTDIIPSDVSDLTDTNNTAFTPKSHTHTMSDVTDLDIPSDVSDLTDSTGVIPTDVSDLADSTGVIPTDVSDLTDTNNTQFTPKSHTHTESDITDLGDYIEKSSTSGLVKNDGTIDTTQYISEHQSLDSKTVTLTKQATAESGYAATYVLSQGGTSLTPKINIPKDFLVKSATVETCSVDDVPVEGYVVGDKYLDFVVNSVDGDATPSHIYLKVTELVDVYSADNSTLVLGTGNIFSIKDGGVTFAKISSSAIGNGANQIAAGNHTHSNYVEKSQTAGLIKNDGTIDTTQYVSDVSGKADVADFDTIEATITYIDTTTETVEFYIVPRT